MRGVALVAVGNGWERLGAGINVRFRGEGRSVLQRVRMPTGNMACMWDSQRSMMTPSIIAEL